MVTSATFRECLAVFDGAVTSLQQACEMPTLHWRTLQNMKCYPRQDTLNFFFFFSLVRVCVCFFLGGGIKLVGVLRPVNRCGYIQAIHISYWRGVGGFLLLESPVLHADADIVTLFPPAKQPSRHAPLERLNPGRSSGKIFFSRVNFLCWLLFRYPFHPHVTPIILPKVQVAGYS